MSDSDLSTSGGKPEAARTAWTPYASAISKRTRPLWVEACKRAAIAAVIAGVFVLLGRERMAVVVASIALLLVLLAAVAPRAYRAIDRFFLRAGAIVGRVLAYVLLAPVFFFVITPLRLVMRTGSRARWKSSGDPRGSTHWKTRDRKAPRLDRPF